MERKKAYTAALLQVLIIGFSFLFVKIALLNLSAIEVLIFRFLFASATVILISKFKKYKISKDAFLHILPLSILYPVMFFGFQTYGLLYATSSEGGIVHALVPIFTSIFSIFILGEKTNKLQNLMMLISISGLLFLTLINTKSAQMSIRGTAYLLISIMSLALNTVLSRKYVKSYSFRDITSVIIISGTIIFLIMGIPMGFKISSLLKLLSFKTFFSIFYLGVIASYGTSLLSNYALRTLEASKVSILSNITPIITVVVGVIVLKEPFGIYQLIGILITLTGVIGANVFARKNN